MDPRVRDRACAEILRVIEVFAAFGTAVACACGQVLAAAARQWRLYLFITCAILLAVATVTLRWEDAGQPAVSSNALDHNQLGVFTNINDRVVLATDRSAESRRLGIEPPEYRFAAVIKPGTRAYGQYRLVRLNNPGLWRLSIDRPLTILFTLPHDAELADWSRRGVTVDPPMAHSCASWWTGKERAEASAELRRDAFGHTMVTCTVPAVGDVGDLDIDVQFTWPDTLRRSAGLARNSSAIQVARSPAIPNDGGAAVQGLFAADKIDVQMQIGTEERLADAFPQPVGGTHNERTWSFEIGGDLDYTIERPRERIWLQPTIDGCLLLSGAMFGIAPAAWRGRRRTRSLAADAD
ncbi:hypothetical protein [Actinoplanes sp. NPDC020271]|uniref:hypothetical protein n=1 Tax=Actinoplanes sp. NPDC020271 TaxID=3363896 RepID=UPI0037929AD4